MASLTQLYKKQTKLAILNAHENTTSVTMRLATSEADSHGFIVKDIAAADFDEFSISSAELTTLFGASASAALMLNGNASPLVTVHVTQKLVDGNENSDVAAAAITQITSFTGGENNKLAWLLLNAPAQPIVANSVITLSQNYTFVTQVTSRRPLIKGTGDNDTKAKVSVELHKVHASAQGSFIPQTVYATILTAGSSSNNYVNTLEILGAAGLENDSEYEMQFTVYNLGEDGEQASPASAQKRFTPNANPAAPSSLAANTTLTADSLPSLSHPVTIDADWTKSANTTGATIRVEKWSGGYYQNQRTELVITSDQLGDMTAGASHALPSIQIPTSFFGAGEYSVQVKMRIMTQESDGASGNGNWSDDLTIKKAVIPVMNDLNIRQNTAAVAGGAAATYGVNDAGLQVVQGSFSNVGDGALTHKKIVFGAESEITPDGTNYQTSHAYTDIDGGNKIITYKIEKADPNGTQVDGQLHKYIAQKSITLVPFKVPNDVTVTMTAGAANTAPSYELTLGALNGNTISKYVAKAKYQAATTTATDGEGEMIVLTSPDPYSSDLTPAEAQAANGTPIVATANIAGESYVPGQYKIEVTTDFTPNFNSAQAAQYANTYEMSVVNESSAQLFFKTPTLSSVSYIGAAMTINGSTEGSNMTGAGSVAGYTFHHADGQSAQYSIQIKENTSVVINANGVVNGGATAVSEIFDFESVLTFDADIKDLSWASIDGLVMLDPSDAPSVLKILSFVDTQPAIDAANAAKDTDTADRTHNTELTTLTDTATAAAAAYNAALLAAPAASTLSDAISALQSAQQAFDSANGILVDAGAAVNVAEGEAATAQTAYDTDNNTYIGLNRIYAGYNGVGVEGDDNYEPAITGTNPVYIAAQAVKDAAVTARNDANAAFVANGNASNAAALVAADEALTEAQSVRDAAYEANNNAYQNQNNALTTKTATQATLTDADAEVLRLKGLRDGQITANKNNAEAARNDARDAKNAAQAISDASALVVAPLLSAKNSADAAVTAKGSVRDPDADGLDAAAHIIAVNTATNKVSAVLTGHN